MLVFDHVGTLVRDLEKAKAEYETLTGESATESTRVESQKVNISFVGNVELIQPDADTPLARLLDVGAVFYHVAYRTLYFDQEVGRLLESSYIKVDEAFNSEVFGGKRCQFFRNNLGHLIELVEG